MKPFGVKWLFAIYMGKPVGSRFGQMLRKIQGWQISSRNRVYHLYKSVPYTQKRLRKPEAAIKEGFEEMEHEFPFETFRPWKQDYLCRHSVAPGNFPLKQPEKSCSIYFLTGFSGDVFVNGKQPVCVCVFSQVACYSRGIKMTGKPKVCRDRWWSSLPDCWPAAILYPATTFHPNIGWKLSVVSQAVIVN